MSEYTQMAYAVDTYKKAALEAYTLIQIEAGCLMRGTNRLYEEIDDEKLGVLARQATSLLMALAALEIHRDTIGVLETIKREF